MRFNVEIIQDGLYLSKCGHGYFRSIRAVIEVCIDFIVNP